MANKVLSIYVGNDAIRVAEMQKNNNKTVILSNAAEIATPNNSINDGYLVDITAISEAIKSAIFGRGFTAKEVIFTVQSKKIASKDIEIPYVKNEKKMQSILQANSGEYFPMSNAADYCYAYTFLEDFVNEDGHKCRVSAVAAPNDLVKCYYELASELKYTVKAVDYFGNSIIQLLQMQMTEGRVDMVLQVEKDATYVNVMRGKTVVLQRNVPYGKNAVINALMDVKKISEKDAKTLLSNETLLDQHVTADEYAQTVQYLVSGIGRVVEYHRTKNKQDILQGIKIFGEGSAIAGIEKILERELGAPVQHFETLSGVQIKGQASLTAEEVLRYLPNIGAVIDPMNLRVGAEKTRSYASSETVFKTLVGVLVVETLVVGTWFAYTWNKYTKAVEEKAQLERDIEEISDIEEIARKYEQAQAEYNVINDFEKSTHSLNEYMLQFVTDLEEKMPYESYINEVEAVDGNLKFVVKTGLHEYSKNEVADALLMISELPYVKKVTIPDADEEWFHLYVLDYDAATDTKTYATEDIPQEDLDRGVVPAYIRYTPGEPIPAEYKDCPIETLVQTTYEITVEFFDPNAPVEEVPVEGEEFVPTEEVEEGGAE